MNWTVLKNEVKYGPLEKTKALIWNGVIKGQVNDTYSGRGAMAADFSLSGDLRDVTLQSWNILFDQKDFKGVITALAGVGIAFSTMPMFDYHSF